MASFNDFAEKLWRENASPYTEIRYCKRNDKSVGFSEEPSFAANKKNNGAISSRRHNG